MDIEKNWEKILAYLNQERSLKLTKGSEFNAKSDVKNNEIMVVPKETGIARRISKLEWTRFVEKFNDVEKSGYDPMRPGHYAKISFNSSYLIAIVKASAEKN